MEEDMRSASLRGSPSARKVLTPAMDNALAWSLGKIALRAGDRDRADVGDHIDRGLILLRLLNEGGFVLIATEGSAERSEAIHPSPTPTPDKTNG